MVRLRKIIVDFTELKSLMQGLGKDADGKPISKLFMNYVEKTTKKTFSIVKMLGMNNNMLLSHLPKFKGSISSSELEKVLANKGFRKAQIAEILKDF